MGIDKENDRGGYINEMGGNECDNEDSDDNRGCREQGRDTWGMEAGHKGGGEGVYMDMEADEGKDNRGVEGQGRYREDNIRQEELIEDGGIYLMEMKHERKDTAMD